MSHYGVFGGWFTLFGTRGRISHILVLIIAWFVFSIAFLFSLYGGLGLSIFLMDFQLFQNAILNKDTPPIITPTKIPEDEIARKLGEQMLENIIQNMKPKLFDQKKSDLVNNFFKKNWMEFVQPLREKMLDYDTIWNAMGKCGALRTPEDAKLDGIFYEI